MQLRTGLLHRKVLSVPRNRIRSVQTDARLLHRLLGLVVLRVSTGRADGSGAPVFELDAVEVSQVPRLRATLLAESAQPADEPVSAAGTVLARWHPSWLRYAPLSLSGLLTITAGTGALYETGLVAPLQNSRLGRSAWDSA